MKITRERISWQSMWQRVKSRVGYAGIVTVCDRWKSFANFLADMGPRPDGMTLDRIDSNGHYTPDNCRWASAQTQARNQRFRKPVTVDGRTQYLYEWADETGLPLHLIWCRIYLSGWSTRDAVSTPVRPRGQGVCKLGHPLNGVRYRRAGGRYKDACTQYFCRICHRAYNAERSRARGVSGALESQGRVRVLGKERHS